MAAFLVATLTNSGLQFRPVVAADLATLETMIQNAVTRHLATGRPTYNGFPSLDSLAIENIGGNLNVGRNDGELLIGVLPLAASGKLALGATTVNWT